jgi:phage N-6-adenine-methyltransferase
MLRNKGISLLLFVRFRRGLYYIKGVGNMTEKKKNVHVSNNSGCNEWYTPEKYIEAVRAVMGSIDLDPASSETANKLIKAKKIYTKDENGLDQKWSGNIWLNPPYSRGLIDAFMKKLAESKTDYDQACFLVNNATETKWFNTVGVVVDAFCLIKGRVKFWQDENGEKGKPLQGQVLGYIGPNVDRFYEVFKVFVIVTIRIKKEDEMKVKQG